MIKIAVAVLFLVLNAYLYHFFATEEVMAPRRTFDEFPLALGDWSCEEREEVPPEMVASLGLTDYLVCNFVERRTLELVGVYVGYHASQIRKFKGRNPEGGRIHPPKHCLPGSGWSILDARLVQLDLPGLGEDGARVNRLIVAKGNQRQIVYYWYHSRGRIIAEDWRKIVMLFWDRARRNRTDGALVRFTIPLDRGNERDLDRAEQAFSDLAPRILSQLAAYVPE